MHERGGSIAGGGREEMQWPGRCLPQIGTPSLSPTAGGEAGKQIPILTDHDLDA